MTRKRAGHGWRPSLPDHRDHRYAAPAAVLQDLPASVDLRSAAMPPIYVQQQWSACTAHAIGADLVYSSALLGTPLWTPSRMFLYYNERKEEGDVGTDGGADIRDGMASVCAVGVCEEALWPYDAGHFSAEPTPACYAAAATHRAASYLRVNQTLTELKGCLAHGYPVVFGMTCYTSFEGAEVGRTGLIPMPSFREAVVGGHCMLLIGYDDATSLFLVRNSWGTWWGQAGYCWLPYAFATDGSLCGDFFTLRLA